MSRRDKMEIAAYVCAGLILYDILGDLVEMAAQLLAWWFSQ